MKNDGGQQFEKDKIEMDNKHLSDLEGIKKDFFESAIELEDDTPSTDQPVSWLFKGMPEGLVLNMSDVQENLFPSTKNPKEHPKSPSQFSQESEIGDQFHETAITLDDEETEKQDDKTITNNVTDYIQALRQMGYKAIDEYKDNGKGFSSLEKNRYKKQFDKNLKGYLREFFEGQKKELGNEEQRNYHKAIIRENYSTFFDHQPPTIVDDEKIKNGVESKAKALWEHKDLYQGVKEAYEIYSKADNYYAYQLANFLNNVNPQYHSGIKTLLSIDENERGMPLDKVIEGLKKYEKGIGKEGCEHFLNELKSVEGIPDNIVEQYNQYVNSRFDSIPVDRRIQIYHAHKDYKDSNALFDHIFDKNMVGAKESEKQAFALFKQFPELQNKEFKNKEEAKQFILQNKNAIFSEDWARKDDDVTIENNINNLLNDPQKQDFRDKTIQEIEESNEGKIQKQHNTQTGSFNTYLDHVFSHKPDQEVKHKGGDASKDYSLPRQIGIAILRALHTWLTSLVTRIAKGQAWSKGSRREYIKGFTKHCIGDERDEKQAENKLNDILNSEEKTENKLKEYDETLGIKSTKIDGSRCQYRIHQANEKPVKGTVVLFHGNGQDISNGGISGGFSPEDLNEQFKGYHVVMMEYPKYLGTGGDNDRRSIEKMFNKLYPHIKQENPEVFKDNNKPLPVVSVGHSVGGYFAADFANKHGEVTGLVLHNTYSNTAEISKEKFGVLASAPVRSIQKTFNEEVFNTQDVLKHMRPDVAVAIVHGDKDEFFKSGPNAEKNLKAASSILPSFEKIQDGGHNESNFNKGMLMVESQMIMMGTGVKVENGGKDVKTIGQKLVQGIQQKGGDNSQTR